MPLPIDQEYERKFARNVGCQWIRTLDSGAYGVVSLVKKWIAGEEKQVVLKRQSCIEQWSRHKDEYEIHKYLWDEGGCENIIRLLGKKKFENDVGFFLEYAECGDILRRIPMLVPSKAQFYFRQIIAGLDYIHSKGVVHRDIKPDNLFLTGNSVLKIGDFGLAEFYKDENDVPYKIPSGPGTHTYAAPEIFLPSFVDGPPADIWSAGVVLLNMLTNDQPWEEAFDEDEEYRKYAKNDLEDMDFAWEDIEVKNKAFVLKLLTIEVSKRATIQEIQADPWFKEDITNN